MEKIPVDRNMSSYIERLDYECGALKNLLVEMDERGKTDSPAFARWEKQYLEAFAAFQTAKIELEQHFLKPEMRGKVNWHLDYATSTLTVEE